MEDLFMAVWKPRLFDVYCLEKSISGLGTDEETLVEILTTRSSDEVKEIKELFLKKGKDLEEEIRGDTSGQLKKLLISLLSTEREKDEGNVVNMQRACDDAKTLFDAGKKIWLGTDGGAFVKILSTRSFLHLKATFSKYRKIAGREIDDSVELESYGNIESGLRDTVEIVRHSPAYFARRLYNSMKGLGTDELSLTRIVVSRSEIDMVQIKDAFLKTYEQSLASYIKGDTIGLYRKLLLLVIGN